MALSRVVGEPREAEPRGVGAESPAGRCAAELVLEHVVHVLDRAGLLPVPGEQVSGLHVAAVAHDSEVFEADLTVEIELLSEDFHGHVTERLGVFRPIAGRELDVGREDRFVRSLFDELPGVIR